MKRFFLLSFVVVLCTATLAQAQKIPVTTDSDVARVQYVKGVHATDYVDFDRARIHFDAALAADPDFAMAHLYRAILSGGEHRSEHVRQAAAAASQISEVEHMLINSYEAHLSGDHDREVATLKDVVERFPNDPEAHLWLANTEGYLHNNTSAGAAAARKGLQADPSYAPLYNVLGYAEMAQGNTDAAEQAFREQIRLAPDEPNPYDSYGEFLMNQPKLDEAEAQYKMALTKNPNFENARTMLARIGVARSNGRFEQAIADGDAEALASLYTSGAVVYAPNMKPIQGREAIKKLFAGYFDAGTDGVELETVEFRLMGDYAHEIGTGEVFVDGDGVDTFSYSVLWVKDGDQWRLHRDIWNSDRPAAGTGSN